MRSGLSLCVRALRLTPTMDEAQRIAATGAAMGADIALNYPLWVAAKRLGVGLSAFPPSIREVYRGGGSLWFSLAPTVMVEDHATRWLQSTVLPQTLAGRELLSAAASGAIAAACVTSQVEHLITASHTRATSMSVTTAKLYNEHGVRPCLFFVRSAPLVHPHPHPHPHPQH